MAQLTKFQRAILSGTKGDLKVTDLPGIGENIGKYMNNMGYYRVSDLAGQVAEDLYHKHCMMRGFQDDPCFLYVFRMAIYFAEHDVTDPDQLKWWTFRREGEGTAKNKRGGLQGRGCEKKPELG